MGLEQRLLQRLRELRLPLSSRIVIGFSGGGDSLALVGAMRRIAEPGNVSLLAAHVDHGLRSDSAAEQAIVAEAAARLGVPFRGLRIEPERLARHAGVGIEEAARRERYRMLADLSQAEDARLVALAHHQTDQAETVLLHLLRGAGLAGAAGMAERTELTVPWWDEPDGESPRRLPLWRPFLTEPKQVIRQYGADLSVSPVEDPSNDNCDLRRNAIRHRVLPLLEEIQPGAIAALARYAELAAADDAYLAAFVERLATHPGLADGVLPRSLLLAQPLALQRRWIRRWLARLVGETEISAERIDAVRGLARSGQGGAEIQIGRGFSVARSARELRIIPPRTDAAR